MLLLWLALGIFAGGIAHRLADRLLEPSSGGSIAWLPRCPRCGRAQSIDRRIALIAWATASRCPGCALGADQTQIAVEVVAGLAAATIAWRAPSAPLAGAYCAAGFILLVVALTDLRDGRIPRRLMDGAIIAAIVAALVPGLDFPLGADPPDPVAAAAGGLVGAAAGGILWGVARLARPGVDRDGVSLIRIAAFVGLVSGFPAVAAALLVGFAIDAAIALRLAGRRTRLTRLSPIAPGLAIGALLALFAR